MSLSPELDPCCSLLSFDYYCLRSSEPELLLLPFVGRFRQHPSLLLLPSYAYSAALARHIAESASSSKASASTPSGGAELVLNMARIRQLLHITDPVGLSAEELAVHALGLFPALLPRLIKECEAPAAASNSALKHRLFTGRDDDGLGAAPTEMVRQMATRLNILCCVC